MVSTVIDNCVLCIFHPHMYIFKKYIAFGKASNKRLSINKVLGMEGRYD